MNAPTQSALHSALATLYRAQDLPLGGWRNQWLDRAAVSLREAGRPDLAELVYGRADDVMTELWRVLR